MLDNIQLSKSVIVLDLDDTLYKEADYQNSGFREVTKYIKKNYKLNINYTFIKNCIYQKKNVLQELCKNYKLKKSIFKSLLWIYRLHKPKIHLKKNVKTFISKIKKYSLGVAILTDGRSITQRLKLHALGIDNLPFYISEDYHDKKPSLKRFKLIMKNMPAEKYIYIADNPAIDFLAPNKLKWVTIGIRGNKNNIYSQKIKKKNYNPNLWIKKLSQLFRHIKK
jgi:putative hydrolase of the HAD superfamily